MRNQALYRRSGKVMTVMLIVIAVLLVSLTAICLYLFQKEIERRKDVEAKLEASRAGEVRLETELNEVKKEKFLLEEKNKELDDRVNDLSAEVDLEQGISKQLKAELAELKLNFIEEQTRNQKLQDQLKRLADLEEENIAFRSKFEETKRTKEDLEKRIQDSDARNRELNDKIAALERAAQTQAHEATQQTVSAPAAASTKSAAMTESVSEKVGLNKIVISNQSPAPEAPRPAGRILTVDAETNFVIVSVGVKDGVKVGSRMAVYRDDKYLGDLIATQLQEEMSAADFIPPLSGRLVRRDDQVIIQP